MADDDRASSRTESPPPTEAEPTTLDLSTVPPIFVSATHFEMDHLHQLEENLLECGAHLTYDVNEARIILTRVQKKARIQFDLRAKGLWNVEVKPEAESSVEEHALPERPAKRQKLEQVEKASEGIGKSQGDAIVIDDDETESEAETEARKREIKAAPRRRGTQHARAVRTPSPTAATKPDVIKVVKLDWFEDSRKAGTLLPLDSYLTFQCHRIDKPADATPSNTSPLRPAKPITTTTHTARAINPHTSSDILTRAKEDAEHAPKPYDRFGKRKFGHSTAAASAPSWSAGHGTDTQYAHLLQKTTTEDEAGYSSDLPSMPEWVTAGVKYACQRRTPPSSPNDPFIALLKKIKLARLLTNDEIGVRAYSTSIASLAAYPHKIVNPREILALPGCDAKIANLFVEWANTGKIRAVEDVEADEDMKVLRLFYEIWGVGAATAREFYYDRGWKDLDDIVEYGWSTLTRVQQIGVKYYEEFLDPIPRAEVEEIGRIVHRHAVKVRDEGVQSLIVGGYRRGKEACGDVDMIISHPDEEKTLNIVNDIVASLEEEGWITHTLLLSLNSTKRNQETLPFKGSSSHGGGFDTLDKALVVWQDPHWPTKDTDLATNPKAKNPNIHRRVDIIISTWRTVGCAVTGWSGGTTFQRDLRRYAKNVKGWKFDSSGVRDRGTGEVQDLERYYAEEGKARAKTMVEAEKRVFEGLGLVYREPWERCTG